MSDDYTTYRRATYLIVVVCAWVALVFFAGLAFGATIQTATSPDGQWRVEILSTPDGSGIKRELYSTPAVGGVRRKISGDVPHDHDVAEFAITPDSRRVAFRKGRTATGAWGLYSVAISGGAVTPLSAGLPYVETGYRVTNGDVHALCTEIAGGSLVPFVVSITGGARREPGIFADGFNDGTTGAWR